MDKLVNKTIQPHVIQVAVGIIANNDGELLVAKRPDHWLGGGFWEFPGGKLESNEDSVTALKRELLEEVGIKVDKCSPLIRLTYEYPERIVILHAWRVDSFSGHAEGLEGQEICWRSPGSLNTLNMLPANRAIVVATQLPDICLIASSADNQELLLQHIDAIPSGKINLIQLRDDGNSFSEFKDFALAVLALCQAKQITLLLDSNNLKSIEDVNADGIILRPTQLFSLNERPLPADKWVAATCHHATEIAHAEQLGVDFLCIGPENNHHTTESLRWLDLTKLISDANLPVYAFGNLNIKDLEVAKDCGAHGIAIDVDLNRAAS